MKKKPPVPHPSDGELRILQALWRLGPSSAREVHNALEGIETGYTTTLKLMQIMHDKKLVSRDERERTHVYTASVREEDTQRAAAGQLVQKLFGGSMMALMQQALAAKPASREELQRIRELIDSMDASEGRHE